eukprot:TRINITY_DN603_c0_g1_i2.p1 TRINITY_DN603_c0_g1~~TRINITY_DN603_c0_g1_i2.p1  ORF type:complete len:250 (+),score=50.39 TRINITY_DN603_c0_g1_i2:69-818(+)
MNKCLFTLLSILFCLFPVLFAQPDPTLCKINYGGNSYDLNNLRKPGTDYMASSASQSYYINMCGPLASFECWSTDTDMSACQSFSGFSYSLGKSKTQTVGPSLAGGSFRLSYSGGDLGRSYSIDFSCGTSAGQPVWDSESPIKTYNFKWSSNLACGGNPPSSGSGSGTGGESSGGGLSGGSIFMILVTCLLFVYCVGGVLFLKFQRQAEGLDVIPNKEFWFSLPGLVKDGVVFSWGKITGRGGSYDSVK